MDGILLVYKEAGMTSHDVVYKLRKILNIKKIGHSGTLDPDATGVLLVLINRACKILPYLEDTDKEYIATLELGKKTLSDDCSGEILETKKITPIQNFSSLLQTFLGEQEQLPPLISSVRVNGKKLYEYARNHEKVIRPKRKIYIHEIEALDEKQLIFRVVCSSGTYVRSLCADIAQKSNNLGCMKSLVRTKVGRFHLKDCVTLKQVEQGNFRLFSIYDALSHFPYISYDPIKDVYHGKTISLDCKDDEVVIVHQNEVVALYRRHHGQWFSCVRGLL